MQRTTVLAMSLGSGGVFAAFLAVMAFVHTPQGLALWGRIRGSQSCPYGATAGASPQERDARRRAAARALRGPGTAAVTTFLGFELDKTRRLEVQSWARSSGAHCHSTRHAAADLECDVPPQSAAQGADARARVLFFGFDSRDVLKSVHVMTDYADAPAAAAAFAALSVEAGESFGECFSHKGEPSAAYLSAALLRQVRSEYRMQNLFAQLMATRLTSSYLVEQTYRALTD